MAEQHAEEAQELLPGRDALAAAAPPMRGSEGAVPRGQQASGSLLKCMFWIYDSGPACLTAAALVFAVAAALVKALPGTPLLEVICLRSVVTCIASYVSARVAKVQPLLGPKALWPLLALRGACGEAGGYEFLCFVCIITGPTAAITRKVLCRVCCDAVVLLNPAAAHPSRCCGSPVPQSRVLCPPGLAGA